MPTLKSIQTLLLTLGLALWLPATIADVMTPPTADNEPSPHPDFSGYWLVNPDLSDNIEQQLKKLQTIARFKRSQKRQESNPDETNREIMDARLHYIPSDTDFFIDDVRQHFQKIRTLQIRHSDPLLRFKSSDGTARRIYSDGRGAHVRASGSLDQTVSFAAWEKAAIIIESFVTERMRLLESISLDTETQQLILVSTYIAKPGDDAVEFRLVYDPAKTRNK